LFPNADDLLFFPRGGGCGFQPWRVGGVTTRPRSPAPPSFSPHSPSPPPLRWRTEEKGKTPLRVGEWPAEGRPRGIGLPVKAAQGQKSSAQGDLPRGLSRRCGRAPLAGGAPAGVARGAKGSFPSPEDSSRAHTRVVARRSGQPGCRPSHRARARAYGRVNADGVGGKAEKGVRKGG
jgi:hypothetical protein